jgi:hypothetical protein
MACLVLRVETDFLERACGEQRVEPVACGQEATVTVLLLPFGTAAGKCHFPLVPERFEQVFGDGHGLGDSR